MLQTAEEHLIKAFFVRERQERYLLGLGNPKKRKKLTNEFCHFNKLDPRFIVNIQTSKQKPEDIYMQLAQLGAPEVCWVVSDDSLIDARRAELREILKEIVGRTFATFLCCIDGKLSYFENEEGRWILHRP
jgi:hypothetical protein